MRGSLNTSQPKGSCEGIPKRGPCSLLWLKSSCEGIPKEGSLQALLRGSREGSPEAAAVLWSLQAASHEPPGSPEVSMCFANRSAALLHLGHFEVSGQHPPHKVLGAPEVFDC